MSTLIEDEVLREFIKHAEKASDEKDFQTCALLTRISFLLGRLKRRYDWWKDREGHRIIDDFDIGKSISNVQRLESLNEKEKWLQFNISHQLSRLPLLFDNSYLGLDSIDRGKFTDLTPRLRKYPSNMSGSLSSDEVIVVGLLESLVSGENNWSGPQFERELSLEECLWIINFTIETLLRWQSEQRGTFTQVDPKYIDALIILEKSQV